MLDTVLLPSNETILLNFSPIFRSSSRNIGGAPLGGPDKSPIDLTAKRRRKPIKTIGLLIGQYALAAHRAKISTGFQHDCPPPICKREFLHVGVPPPHTLGISSPQPHASATREKDIRMPRALQIAKRLRNVGLPFSDKARYRLFS